MKLEKLSSLIEALSSIAVVITLIVLIVEIRQNTEALNAQSRQALLVSAQNELLASVDHPDALIAIGKPGDLTPEEIVMLDSWLQASIRSREFAWLQYQSGLIDQEQWDTELSVIRGLTAQPRIRLWWTEQGRTRVSVKFADFVDGVIKNTPENTQMGAGKTWNRALQKD
jgi:hypothetical protein